MAARSEKRLSDASIKSKIKKDEVGYHADGGNLYFRIAKADETRSTYNWIFRFARNGVSRDMGLGKWPDVTLARAREKAADGRQQLDRGIDPIDERKALRVAAVAEAAKSKTFDECAADYITAHEPSWKNAKHRQQWTNTLRTYVSPVFGKLPVQSVDTPVILKTLQPIWSTKTETAVRVRMRIEAVLDWATVAKLRQGDNPARWHGCLEYLLPKPSEIRKRGHHPALPFKQVGAFMGELRQREGIAARALEFIILTAARTGDIIGSDREDKPPMQASHVDGPMWTIPNIKTETTHAVPLSKAAMAVLAGIDAPSDAIVFPGAEGGPLSNMSMSAVIERTNDDRETRGLPRYVDPKQRNRDVAVHSFRSTFRDWAAERTHFANEVVEMALAHAIDGKVEAAYRRGDLFDKRSRLMDAWAEYCGKIEPAATAKVVTLAA